tara:strand:+ start:2053 stop:2736 length:684 start_codon:yes stop_codon:yes gene_type:complete
LDNLRDTFSWPCELPEETKRSIVLSAIKLNQLPQTTHSTEHIAGIVYVKSGIACITFGSDQTNTMNSGIYGSGTWLGGSMINHDLKLHATIEEIEPISIIYFPKDKIDHLAQQDPFIYKWLYNCSLSTQKQWLMAQVVSLYDRETRVVYTLLEIAKHTKQIQGSKTKLHASQKQLSIITGISRPRLNEVLKNLESNQEISVSRGAIHLLDEERLQQRLMSIRSTVYN